MRRLVKPKEPTYPGKVLKDEIDRRAITQRSLSACVGMAYTRMNSILNGKLPLTTNAAMQIAAALDVEPELLMEMQIAWDMKHARENEATAARLAEIREKAATKLKRRPI